MRKNFSGNITGLNGVDLIDKTSGKDEPITVSQIVVNALVAQDQGADGPEQYKRYQLASRIFKGGVVEVTSAEIELIKARVAANFPPVVTGFIWERLEQDVTSAGSE